MRYNVVCNVLAYIVSIAYYFYLIIEKLILLSKCLCYECAVHMYVGPDMQ